MGSSWGVLGAPVGWWRSLDTVEEVRGPIRCEEAEMRESFRIGTIAGVRVGVNWSVGVIFALLVLGLAAGRFPILYPDLPGFVYGIAGAIAGVVFLGSLLAHELAHAIVARRNGVGVEAITLWMFGGVAKLEGEPTNPGADLRVAVVGPAVSLVLAVLFAAMAMVLELGSAPGLAVGTFQWLALINLLLAVFNLIPAAPLDGGRILRALWWWRTGNRTAAAVGAARAGRGFGWFLVVGGIALALVGGGIAGLWFVLIGWFISAAARSEEEYTRMADSLVGVKVADVMSSPVVAVPAHVTLQEFIDAWVFAHPFSTFPVVDDQQRPVGLLSLREVKHLGADQRAALCAGDAAMALDEVTTAQGDDDVAAVMVRMSSSRSGRALVLDGDRVVGLVSPVDVMRRVEFAQLRSGR